LKNVIIALFDICQLRNSRKTRNWTHFSTEELL
jgi:hypothetical protein